jgi:hypothetical protein
MGFCAGWGDVPLNDCSGFGFELCSGGVEADITGSSVAGDMVVELARGCDTDSECCLQISKVLACDALGATARLVGVEGRTGTEPRSLTASTRVKKHQHQTTLSTDMAEEQAAHHLLNVLEERGLDVDLDKILLGFEDEDTKTDAAAWVEEYLQEDTLLTKEELEL